MKYYYKEHNFGIPFFSCSNYSIWDFKIENNSKSIEYIRITLEYLYKVYKINLNNLKNW